MFSIEVNTALKNEFSKCRHKQDLQWADETEINDSVLKSSTFPVQHVLCILQK